MTSTPPPLPRVVITGIGLVSALGCDPATVTAALRAGTSGIRPVTDLPGTTMAGMVNDFDPGHYMPKNKIRRMDRVNTYVIAAARMALAQAGLDEAAQHDCGIVVGTGFAGLSSVVKHQRRFLDEGIAQLSPINFPTTVYNASAGLAAIELGLRGPNSTVTGVDLPAEHALLHAMLMLAGGMAEHLIVVGADELSEALALGLHDMGLLADAAGRVGMRPGEGAAALLLERADTAAARQAKVLGSLDGIGVGARPAARFDYNGAAATAVIAQALRQAGIDRDALGWLSLGSNGLPALAQAEADTLRAWDADAAAATDGDLPIAALKTLFGDFAGSGLLRLALGLLCTTAGFVPASHGERPVDPARPFLHLGLGIGGNAAALVARAAV